MRGSSLLPSRTGGRPPHPLACVLIPLIVRDLGRARVADIHRACLGKVEKPISQSTLKKYCELLSEQGQLRREIEIDNRTPAMTKRPWQMVWYLSP